MVPSFENPHEIKEIEEKQAKIKEAAIIMDITVLDHVIIGQSNYLSLADEGMLN